MTTLFEVISVDIAFLYRCDLSPRPQEEDLKNLKLTRPRPSRPGLSRPRSRPQNFAWLFGGGDASYINKVQDLLDCQ